MTRTRGGFTLLEVVTATSLLTLLMFGLIASSSTSAHVSEVAQERRLALSKADAVLSRLLADAALPTTWSDSKTGDPKLRAASNAVATPSYPQDYTYDLKTDLGETFPRELILGEGSVLIESFQTNPIVPWTTTRPFAWNAGRIFKLTVTVRWLPAIQRRTASKAAKPTTEVKLTAIYYRTPPL